GVGGWVLWMVAWCGWLVVVDGCLLWMVACCGWVLVVDGCLLWMVACCGWLLVVDGCLLWMVACQRRTTRQCQAGVQRDAKQAPSKRIARMKHMASQNRSQTSGTGSSAGSRTGCSAGSGVY